MVSLHVQRNIFYKQPINAVLVAFSSVLSATIILGFSHVLFLSNDHYIIGVKLFPTLPPNTSKSYKLVALALQCTGGGILVPIFINSIPVTLGTDAYPICIFISFLLHTYLPIVREVCKLSPIFKTAMIIMYECQRAYVVCKLTKAAGTNIPASDFAFPVLGPIICGGIGGCGGAFLPMSKGLDPLKDGLAQPMYSALIAATFFHLFLHTSLSEGVVNAADKARVLIVVFFIALNLSSAFPSAKAAATATASPNGKKTD